MWMARKTFFAERDGDDEAKNARGGIAEEVVLTHSTGTDFEGCTFEEALRFWAARLLGSHFFEVDWFHRRRSGGSVADRLRLGQERTGQKMANDVF